MNQRGQFSLDLINVWVFLSSKLLNKSIDTSLIFIDINHIFLSASCTEALRGRRLTLDNLRLLLRWSQLLLLEPRVTDLILRWSYTRDSCDIILSLERLLDLVGELVVHGSSLLHLILLVNLRHIMSVADHLGILKA